MPALILASTSRYRRALLERLGLPFDCIPPEVDETAQPGETPEALVRRLAVAKARAVAADHPGARVIGSDQLAALDDAVLGKPGSRERAAAQLAAQSGRTVRFLTAVAVIHGDSGYEDSRLVETRVQFRKLDAAAIARYLDREDALDCAGSFKSEALGITLFESVSSDDPTALEGLPLLATCALLRASGLDPL